MTERPILFSAPMVRAILEGRKTQTRRVLKQAIGPSLSVDIKDELGVAELSWLHGDGPGHDVHEMIKRVRCPYGQTGDRLWVRETWAEVGVGPQGWAAPVYIADDDSTPAGGKWRPSIHMPRRACRILLEVVSVRVERLQDISPDDCIAEGAWREQDKALGRGQEAVAAYRDLWESINGAGSWDANPWVWVIEFKRVTP